MAFTVKKIDFRPWPVTVLTHESDDAGNVSEREETFVCHFRPLGECNFEIIMQEVDRLHPMPKTAEEIEASIRSGVLVTALRQRREAEFWKRVVCGWGPEVQDEDGVSITFSSGVLTDLITGPDGPAIVRALSDALAQLRDGRAPEKNLPVSPAPGPAGEVQAGPTSSTPIFPPGESAPAGRSLQPPQTNVISSGQNII
ncbi:MAG: hypothetical protein FWD77_04515 [Betaproteobacteria bacterium]|nr:hypothetical protein [Betaproteobacteria bacterium]